MLHAGQPGFETVLAKELGAETAARGPGWVRGAPEAGAPCFAHWSMDGERELAGATARELSRQLVDYFLETSRDERYEEPWPLVVEAGGEPGAERRAHAIEEAFLELARKRMSRVVKLARPGRPERGPRRGLFAYLAGGTLLAAREARFGGQRRMADDPQAPSRSFLKVEEAYHVLGAAPADGETVVDLGAAPGGWSYSAAKRGARVVAVDNGPLKGGALHPLIEHREEDAFKHRSTADWLFCDMIEEPDRVLELTRGWLAEARCRRFVVVLKYGRVDPLPLLRRVKGLSPLCSELTARHLFHNREEFAVVGVRA